jgi:protein TonB
LPKRKDHGPLIFGVTFGVSVAAHLSFAIPWLHSAPSGDLGSVDFATNAISVNLEASDVIDAVDSSEAKAAATSTDGTPGDTTEVKKPDDVKEVEETQPPPKSEPDEPVKEEQARQAEQAEAERQRLAEEAEKQEQLRQEAEREETKRRAEEAARAQKEAEEKAEDEKKKQEKAKQIAVAGDVASQGAQEAESSQGRVSASQGDILNYGARLRAIISSHAPRNIRGKTVKVLFHVAPSGGLISVSLMQSSHDAKIDDAIVDLVKKLSSQFPPPPPGATASQLSYNIEIIFR